MEYIEFAVVSSVLLLIYNYFLYPGIVIGLSRLYPVTGTEADGSEATLPRVTFIIAAYNEDKVIEKKLDNTLAIDYPAEKLEIMVVADGSDDRTAELARAYGDRGVVVLHTPERRGKTAALNRGVKHATGEIIVFSDANNDYDSFAVKTLVRHFRNPGIGGVCGSKRILENNSRESSEGDSLYWRYESAIKQAESRIGSITGADGEIFAIRKGLYREVDESVINDDAEITFNILDQGYRVTYEHDAKTYEEASQDVIDDFFVKVRMVAGGFQTITRHPQRTILPLSWYSIAFFSHKVLRWMAPVFMIIALAGSIVLSGDRLFLGLLLLQLPVYFLALTGWAIRKHVRLPGVIYVPFYLCTMNLAALFGLIRFVTGKQTNIWRKAVR